MRMRADLRRQDFLAISFLSTSFALCCVRGVRPLVCALALSCSSLGSIWHRWSTRATVTRVVAATFSCCSAVRAGRPFAYSLSLSRALSGDATTNCARDAAAAAVSDAAGAAAQTSSGAEAPEPLQGVHHTSLDSRELAVIDGLRDTRVSRSGAVECRSRRSAR